VLLRGIVEIAAGCGGEGLEEERGVAFARYDVDV